MNSASTTVGGASSGRVLLPVGGQLWSGVRYGCTTRSWGVSTGPWASFNMGLHAGDLAAAAHENRRRLAAALPQEPFWLKQVHGVAVADADTAAGLSPDAEAPVADAAITMQPGRVLAIMTADCMPVVIADTQGRALGVAHAGWRGLAAGVLESVCGALQRRLPESTQWRAWIGPCISQECFEVGEDVRVAFVDADARVAVHFSTENRAGKWHANLPLLARHRLATLGIYDVEIADLCTYRRADLFYSYRRSAVTGRMATVAWLEPGFPTL